MQTNQKENNDPHQPDHIIKRADATYKNKNEESIGSMTLAKMESQLSQRPSRKAKTKEAVQRHLNRDVELLDEKQEKKSSTRKDKIGTPATALTPVVNGLNNGKRSTRSGGQLSAGKASVSKPPGAQNSSAQHVIPQTITHSGSSSIDNSVNLNTNITVKPGISKGADDKQPQSEQSAMNSKSKKQISSKQKVQITPALTRHAAKNLQSKIESDKIPNQEEDDDQMEEEDNDLDNMNEGNDQNISDEDESMLEDSSEHSDEELSDEEEEEILSEEEKVGPYELKWEKVEYTQLPEDPQRLEKKLAKENFGIKMQEDDAIVSLVSKYGTKRWTYIAQMLKEDYKIWGRTGKQCRERWHNHLDPNIKKSPINNEEEIIIFDAHKIYGNKWADIAKLLEGRSDNCIKNYYYSTLRKHIRRINKSLKQCQVAKHLNLKVKTLTADLLFPLVKEGKIQYKQIKIIDPKKFEDLEHTMRMIFNHEDGQQVTQRGIIAAAQNRIKVEKQLQEMRDREQQEDIDLKVQKDKKQQGSNEKILGKRGNLQNKNEYNVQKRQKVTNNPLDQNSANSHKQNDDTSYSKIDEESQQNQKENDEDQIDSNKEINDNSDSQNKKTVKSKNNTPKKKETENKTDQQKIQFPKGLQMKPPVGKKLVKLEGSKSNLNIKQAYEQGMNSQNPIRAFDSQYAANQGINNPFKQSMGSAEGVTEEVTKRNASNQSQNSDVLDKIYKNKKDKKKKKNKDKKSNDKHKKKLLFPFYQINQSKVDDMVAQYDMFQSQQKIFPGCYDNASSKSKSSKDIMSGMYNPQMAHNFYNQSGHQNYPMPFPGFMFHPAYLSQYMPFGNPQQQMEMMMQNPFFKQMMKGSNYKGGSKVEGAGKLDKESKQNSCDKPEQENDGNDKKSKNEKDKAEEFMAEMMNHMQAYYHKMGGFSFPFGMPPHPAFFHQMPMPGQMNPSATPHRDKHHSSAYHKQFTMPITPNNLQSQVFGEKQFFAENQPKQMKKGQNDSDNDKKDDQARQERQQPQYNSNITVMINQYGHFQNRPDLLGQISQEDEGRLEGNNVKKSDKLPEEAIQNLMVSKKNSQKKNDQQLQQTSMEEPCGNGSANFKQQFKPQKIGTLNFQSKLHQQLNSKGVTPSNQQAPLMSTSNFLFNNQNVVPNQNYQPPNIIGQTKNETSLQQRLFAGTPRLFIGNINNQHNTNAFSKRMPTSTTAAAAQAFIQQNEPLKSTKNLNSKETFNGNIQFQGPKLNTKTYAQQMTDKKQGNQVITPKVSTLGKDPEAYRKNLEKMFMNMNNQVEGNKNDEDILSAHAGAFTQKRATASREHSHKKNLNSDDSLKQELGARTSSFKDLQVQKHDEKDGMMKKQQERESVGLFMIPQSHDSQNLNLITENHGQMQGVEVNSQHTKKNNYQTSKVMIDSYRPMIDASQPKTPVLGISKMESIMNSDHPSKEKHQLSNSKKDTDIIMNKEQ